MRAAPLVILVTTLVAAAAVRVLHKAARIDPARGATLERSDPSGRATAAPDEAALPDLPDGSAVTAGGPHMLHGDAHRSHRAHGHIPSRPDVAWTFHADGPIEGQVVTSPDDRTLYVATLGGTLYGLDLSGQAAFHLSLGGRAYGTPSVGPDGTIYVGSDGGAFFAIDPAGHVKWKLETDGDADTSALLTDDGVVVFAAGSRVYGVRGGSVLFRFQARDKVFTSPTLTRSATGEPLIVFGSQDDHVYALTARGQLAFSVDLGHDVDATAVAGDDGTITVGTDGDEIVRFDPEGHILWRTAVGGPVRGALAMARNGDVLAGVYGPSPRLVRVSPAGQMSDGFAVRGQGTRETGVFGGALEDDDGTLVFGAQDGTVRAIDRRGKERWVYDARSDVDAPLTLLADGSLLVADYAGDVTLLRALP